MNLLRNTFTNFKKIKLLITFILITSCTEYTYEYEDGLRLYFKDQFKISKFNSNYYIISINNCNTCLGQKLNLSYLNQHKIKYLTLIIVGKSERKEIIDLLNSLSKKYIILKDPDKNIYQYSTGLGKPLLIITKNNKLKLVKNINDTSIKKLKSYLNKIYF